MINRYLLAAIALVATASASRAQELFRHPFVGGVTDSSAIVSVWLAADGGYTLQYGTDPGLGSPTTAPAVTSTSATDNATKVELTGLQPATRYYYRIATTSGTPISTTFSFKTFPRIGVDAPVTIFLGSCQQRTTSDTGGVFKVAGELGGDLFVQMGDWGYPDERITGFPTQDGSLREAYALKLDTTYPFARNVLSQMAMAYVWDDHDYRGNESDGTLPIDMKKKLAGAFGQYIPHYPLSSETGVWQKVSIGNVDLFIVDARSQRSPIDSAIKGNQFIPPAGHSMLAGITNGGSDQRAWLLNGLRTSKARWKVIVSPVFFNPAASSLITLGLLAGRPDLAREVADKWVGYPADVDSMKALFAAGFGKNVVVVSGDAHTNAYDNGQHSIVPEFLAADLDVENSNLVRLLKEQGFDIWTAMQPDSQRTVGRITVETTPRHRMIIESFGESGTKELTLELADSTGSASFVPSAPATDALSITGATIEEKGTTLWLEIANPRSVESTITLYDISGRELMRVPHSMSGASGESIALPSALAAGVYLGGITIDGKWMPFRLEVPR